MFWIILVCVVTIATMVIAFIEEGIKEGLGVSLFWGFIAFFVGSLLFLSSGLLLSDVLGSNIEDSAKTYYITEKTEIISLKDNNNVNGRFSLGRGYVSEDLYYVYMAETEHGYITDKVKADECYVRYTSDGESRIEEHTAYFNNKFFNFITFSAGKRTIVYVPEGTIIEEYQIDLE